MTARHRFDADYYHRHYEGRERVHSAAEVARLAAGVDGMAAWLGLPVRNVLEVGAGPGFWRAWYRRHRPSVRYRSTDLSEWASRRFGHERRDISRWRPRGAYDLVVCQGVLQYLEDEAAERAISNLAAASRGLLYLEVVTRHDLAHVVDPDRSDTVIHARSGAWYRRRLDAGFRQLGAGLWASRRAPVHFYELEAPPLSAARKPR